MLCFKCSKQFFCRGVDINKKECKYFNKFLNIKNYGEVKKYGNGNNTKFTRT